jgi:hypothetical protein
MIPCGDNCGLEGNKFENLPITFVGDDQKEEILVLKKFRGGGLAILS